MGDEHTALLVQTEAMLWSQSGDANYWLQAPERQIRVNDLLERQRGGCRSVSVCVPDCNKRPSFNGESLQYGDTVVHAAGAGARGGGSAFRTGTIAEAIMAFQLSLCIIPHFL